MTKLSLDGKQAIDCFIKDTAESGKIPGFVLGISNLDDELYFQGAGNNVVNDPTSGPVNPESVFWICSQTKMITALAALKLIEQGEISFDTPVAHYFPQFRNPIIVDSIKTQETTFRPATNIVTVQHLLTFTSGLFYPATENKGGLRPAYSSKETHRSSDPVSEFFRIIQGELPALPLKFEPGTDFAYGWSSDVLGFLIEKVSGQSLEQFCKEHVFDPLNMKTSFYLNPGLRSRLVNLTYRDREDKLHPWANQVDIIERDERKVRLQLGGVGMYSSLRDYLKLLRHLLQINAGREVANPILNVHSVRSIFVPALPVKGIPALSEFAMIKEVQWSTALAVTSEDLPGRRRKGSAFWSGWAGTYHFMDPDMGIAVVFGTQVVPRPFIDIPLFEIFCKVEELIYAGLDRNQLTATRHLDEWFRWE